MLCIVDVDRTFNGSGSFLRGRPRKHGMISKEKKVNKALAKDINVWKSFIRNCPTHASMENRCLSGYDFKTGFFQTS